jgi:nucleoside-diphosphate-sugar epimerase
MKYLVTGGAGFIGSNLTETLLNLGEEVIVLDNLSTGKLLNIKPFIEHERFTFIQGSITDPEICARACEGVDYVLHQAALVSVPGSIKDPDSTYEVNVNGTLTVLNAARNAGVQGIVCASSSAVYGNSEVLPNVETMPLSPLSPYADSKVAVEKYIRSFSEDYGISVVGLRYFNVFGKNQDPSSSYAAVIPVFISGFLKGEQITIYGDGEQTRDFVFVDNIVQANIKAAKQLRTDVNGRSFNIGSGKGISINELFKIIAEEFEVAQEPVYASPRSGEVKDSLADISAAREAFGYEAGIDLKEGLKKTIQWYRER